MKDGICTKCETKEVHIYTNTGTEQSISISMFNSAAVMYYICTNCGYIELFVEDKRKLSKIAEKYPKIN